MNERQRGSNESPPPSPAPPPDSSSAVRLAQAVEGLSHDFARYVFARAGVTDLQYRRLLLVVIPVALLAGGAIAELARLFHRHLHP